MKEQSYHRREPNANSRIRPGECLATTTMKTQVSQSEFPRLCEASVASHADGSQRARTGAKLTECAERNPSCEYVVLLHGLFATRRSMNTLAKSLSEYGYQVINWGYPTFLYNTQQLVDRLAEKVRGLQEDPQVGRIHFVTHSMGGILVRGVLHYGSGVKIQRVVMLAPPNTGSKLTRFPLGPFAWCCPAIADLSESPDSLPNRMNQIADAHIGVIAAEHDFVVPLANTRLSGQTDHCVIPTTHLRIPSHALTRKLVLQFLESGSFSEPRLQARAA